MFGVYKAGVPGQRAADQRLIAFALKDDFVRALDAARNKIGETRSIFVRKALIEAIRARGIPADDAWAFAPDRAGKPRSSRSPVAPPPAPRRARAWPRPEHGGTAILADDTADGNPVSRGPLSANDAVSSYPVRAAIVGQVVKTLSISATAPASPAPRPGPPARRGARTGRAGAGGTGESNGGGASGV